MKNTYVCCTLASIIATISKPGHNHNRRHIIAPRAFLAKCLFFAQWLCYGRLALHS
jgi:hypothetical protein